MLYEYNKNRRLHLGHFVHIQQFDKPLYDLTDYYTEILRPQGFKLLSNGESFLQFGTKVTIKNGVNVMFLANHFACPEIKKTFNPSQLSGEFASVLMSRTNRQTNLSRDAFGAKSLFYYFEKQLLIAATELKFIISLLEEKVAPNVYKIHEYLEPSKDKPTVTEDTFFSKIKRVLPGETLIIFPEGIKKQMHYVPQDQPVEQYPNPAIFFGNAFESSLQARLSVKNTGSFLDGELDTSSVVSAYRNLTDHSLKTFFFDTKFENTKEKILAQDVAEQKNTEHFRVSQQPQIVKECIQNVKIMASPDTLHLPSTLFSSIFRVAHEQKTELMISAHGGHNILGEGWAYLDQLLKDGNQNELKESLKEFFKNKGFPSKEVPFEIEKFLLEKNEKSSLFTLFKSNTSVATLAELLYQKWTRKQPTEWQVSKAIKKTKKVSEVKELYPSVSNTHLEDLLYNSISADSIQAMEAIQSISSYYNITTTFPFLSKEILEVSAKIPLKLNFASGLGNGILRNSMSSILPEPVRKKKGKLRLDTYLISYAESVSEYSLDDEHKVWEYALKSTFYKAKKAIKQENPNEEGLLQAAQIVHRVISLALWLEVYYP